jgi:hypothetical protein
MVHFIDVSDLYYDQLYNNTMMNIISLFRIAQEIKFLTRPGHSQNYIHSNTYAQVHI